jgi:hypothetical protein
MIDITIPEYPMSSRSTRLRAKIDILMPALYNMTHRLWSASDLRARYAAYLVLMHQMVRATVPLMRTALVHCDVLGEEDEVAVGVGTYLRQHVREEMGHDEWVRADLGIVCPEKTGKLLAAMPPPAVASLVGSQYYWVAHYHPVALLGHIAVLEGYPPAEDLAGQLATRSGLPLSAFRALCRHAVLDQRHRNDLFDLIDTLPLSKQQEEALGVSALTTVASLVPIFEALSGSQTIIGNHQPAATT